MPKFEPGYEDPAPLLRQAAAFADPEQAEQRRALIARLHRRSDAVAFLATADAARAADLELRVVAMDVLGQLGYASGRPYREQILPILIAELDQAVDPRLLQVAVTALAHLGDGSALIPVLRLAAHRDADVRQAVAFALPAITGQREPAPEVVEALIELSQDTDERVRDWSTFGLAEQLDVDSPEIRAALTARLDDVDAISEQARAGLLRRSTAHS